VRPLWWMAKLQSMRTAGLSADTLDPAALKPTPHYNMAILEDMAMIPVHNFLLEVLSSSCIFSDVVIVIKVCTRFSGT
jgi:hypothetical protein